MVGPFIRLNLTKSKQSGRAFQAADIVACLKKDQGNGSLPASGRLPPVRILSHQLGISKNTVQAAYEELVAQGVLVNKERQGFFVAPSASFSSPQKRISASPTKLQPSPDLRPPRLRDGYISLSSTFIDKELLPIKKVTECFRSVLKNPGLPYYYDPQGYLPLRKKISSRLEQRGIPAKPENIIITCGSQQALDIICRALPQKKIATENPAYFYGKHLFEMNKMTTIPLRLDPFSRLDLDLWEKTIAKHRPEAIYLTPTFQNPTGYSYSTKEMQAILEMSIKYGFGIIEDDWGSDMLSFSEFKCPMRSLGGPNVLYMNSFTKKLLPSLRLGYLVANDAETSSLLAAKRVSSLAIPQVVEYAVFEFLDRGYFDTHLKKLQQETDQKYLACLEAMREIMPEETSWTMPGGGPLLWLELPRKLDLTKISERLLEKKIYIEQTRSAFFGKPHLHGFKIGFLFLKENDLYQGLTCLAKVIQDQLVKVRKGKIK